jgi:hypothetical protein
MTFGQGEGLAIDDERVYVLLDNNYLEREGHPGDRRGWLGARRRRMSHNVDVAASEPQRQRGHPVAKVPRRHQVRRPRRNLAPAG